VVSSTSAGTIISSFTYTYDDVGYRSSVAEADGARVTWTYDKTYQLVNEHRAGDVLGWSSLTAEQWEELTGDQWETLDDCGAGGAFNVTYTYDSGDCWRSSLRSAAMLPNSRGEKRHA
jgi:hypothetical protein